MATKILIPTPLRPFTDKQDAVEAERRDGRRAARRSDDEARRPQGASLQRAGQAAQLRQRLPERRRHPLPAERADAGQAGRHGQHHPVGRGRRRTTRSTRRTAIGPQTLPELTNDEIKRYSRHLIMPEVGVDGQRKLKAGSVLCIGAGGLGSPAAMYLAAAGVGTHRHRRLRRRRLQQPAAADHPRHAGRRPVEARRRRRIGCSALNPHVAGRHLRDGAVVGERARAVQAATTSSSTAPTTSRRAIS